MRKFETAFGASQHPTGHVSASGPGLKSDDSDEGKDARCGKVILVGVRRRMSS